MEDVIAAIKSADLIILGPGSLYTSVIPNLLVDEIAQEIVKSKAKKIYVCNIMTQPGETDGYSVSDHVKALMQHANSRRIIDAVLVNNCLPMNVDEKYEQAGSYPVKLDCEKLKKLGVTLCCKKLIEDSKEGLVRHSSHRVARAILYWYKKVQRDGCGYFSIVCDDEKQECNV